MAGHIATAKRQDWCTPPHIIEAVRGAFGGTIDLDPCSNSSSLVGSSITFNKEQDGLSIGWGGNTYVNPPYGRGINQWISKCALEHIERGASVIALVPASVDTKIWQDCVFQTANLICFIRGRVKFIQPDTGLPANQGAPMPVCAILWSERPVIHQNFANFFGELGSIVRL